MNIEEELNKLTDEIRTQNFEGSEDEIKIQQILYFDKYVKENIDYCYETVMYSMLHPGEKNPYDSAYKMEGFFFENEILRKRAAVCGSISAVAKIVFNKLGIESDYVYGHINYCGANMGHRWNTVKINNKIFMVDFTASMAINNIGKDAIYDNVFKMFNKEEIETNYRFLFFDELAEKESIGGFKLGEKGREDDYDENGNLKNVSYNAYEQYPNLDKLSSETIDKYYSMVNSIDGIRR